LLRVSPSLDAVIEDLAFAASAGEDSLTLALVQVAVTIFIDLTIGVA